MGPHGSVTHGLTRGAPQRLFSIRHIRSQEQLSAYHFEGFPKLDTNAAMHGIVAGHNDISGAFQYALRGLNYDQRLFLSRVCPKFRGLDHGQQLPMKAINHHQTRDKEDGSPHSIV